MPRQPSRWIAPVAVAVGFGAVLSAAVGLAIVSVYGDWAYPTAAERGVVVAFFGAAGSLAGLVLGLGVAGVCALADRLREAAGPKVVALVGLVALTGAIGLLATRSPPRALTTPLFLPALGLGLLALSLAWGARRHRGPAVAAALGVLVPLLPVAIVWLNLRVLKGGLDPLGPAANIALILAAHAAAVAGSRLFAARFGRRTAPAGPGWRVLGVAIGIPLVSLFAVAPLYEAARRAGAVDAAGLSAPPLGQRRAASPPTGRLDQPDIVLISVDTLRADHVGLLGYDRPVSPNIDSFFEGAFVFERAYATSPWTLPSHMSMLTGLLPSRHGARLYPGANFGHVDALADEVDTLAEVLARSGYQTAAFTGGLYLTPSYGFDAGFDTFEVVESSRMREAVARSLQWIRRAGRPYFLFLHAYDVHRYAPARIHPELGDDGYDGFLTDVRRQGPGEIELRVIADSFRDLGADDRAYLRHLYDNELRGLDEQLGALFRLLSRPDRARSTVVVLTSDHGEEFGTQGRTGHAFALSEALLRVPLLIRLPPPHGGARIDTEVQITDLAPTLFDLAGVPAGRWPEMDGTSLVETMLRGKRLQRPLVAEADALTSLSALVVGRSKYVHSGVLAHDPLDPRFGLLTLRAVVAHLGRGPELYDLAADPAEEQNLAAHRPERTAALRSLLFSLLAPIPGRETLAELETLTPEARARLEALGYVQ